MSSLILSSSEMRDNLFWIQMPQIMGSILSPVQDRAETVIVYFSRVLDKVERHYCVIRRELLAVMESLRSFHHICTGISSELRSIIFLCVGYYHLGIWKDN